MYIYIKDTFFKLSSEKVLEIHNIMTNSNQKSKSKLNMIAKGSSRKQSIMPISMNNMKKVITQPNAYIANINRLLKSIKLKISADFICSNNN